MALFKTRSAAVYGIDAHLIDVEVDMYKSGTARDFITVGMPDTAVRESRERIKSALINSGFGYPNKAVTINLAPANVRKEGAGFDLPMALGILGAMGTVAGLDQHLLVGELSLDGAIRPVRGALSIAVCARDAGHRESDSAGGKCGRGRGGGGRARVRRAAPGRSGGADRAAGGVFAGRAAGARRESSPRHLRARFSRRARPDHGQARAGGGGGGRPQRADDRAAGIGQDHAGETSGGYSAAADVSPKRSRPPRSTASPACCLRARACCASGRFARRITPFPMPG